MDVLLLQASQDAHPFQPRPVQPRHAQDRRARRVLLLADVDQVLRRRHRQRGGALEREHQVRGGGAAEPRRLLEAEVERLRRRRHRRRGRAADGLRHRLLEGPVRAVDQEAERRDGVHHEDAAALSRGDRRVAGSNGVQAEQVVVVAVIVGRGLDERRRRGALAAGQFGGGAEEQPAALPGVAWREAVGEPGELHLRDERPWRPP
ncbi:Os10g0538450 [Oryza sativa Japonica Group]|uniref:Os10g0538450 protein n=1 Tax=Oryza sativa subsp. japonica TaxID=39947 RepID=A0A0P0XX04_ORYSJ|nr:hypothetical protein EE612_052506 [Oryza sativa]BAT11840.1 Os10g0538450 [Oryza sativa Japonica Group]